jgi:ribosomal protein L37AE/L43A
MGDAADDMFNQFMQEEEKRYTLRKACTCGKQLWYRTKEGFWKCKGCKVEVDL